MGKHVDHFVPLGGPFLGAVSLLQAVMVVCVAYIYLCTTSQMSTCAAGWNFLTFGPSLFSGKVPVLVLVLVPVPVLVQVTHSGHLH